MWHSYRLRHCLLVYKQYNQKKNTLFQVHQPLLLATAYLVHDQVILINSVFILSLSDYLSCFHLEFLIVWIYVLFPDLCPSLSAGVVSRVVRTGNFSQFRGSSEEPPVMLETTAAVHPGGSGGAVVNEHGHMIGLVTRLFWGNVSCGGSDIMANCCSYVS